MDLSLLAFVALNLVCAVSGGIWKPGDWYERLNRPSWRPPNAAFPIMWAALYTMSAVAGWLVWSNASPGQLPLAMAVYGAQLVFNAAWSWLFFGLRLMRLALLDLVALWLSILAMAIVFWPISPLATLLVLPYLLWVTIAGVLNLTMIRLNPDEAGGWLPARG